MLYRAEEAVGFCKIYWVGIEPMALYMLDIHSTAELPTHASHSVV